MGYEFGAVLAFAVVAVGFGLGGLTLGKLVRPYFPGDDKALVYECGERPIGTAWFNFNPRFYVIALIFIIFDVEIAFIYPVARVFRRWVEQGSGWFAFIEIFVFVGILLLGLVYVWAKGDLEWIRAIRGDPRGAQDVAAPVKSPEIEGKSERDAA